MGKVKKGGGGKAKRGTKPKEGEKCSRSGGRSKKERKGSRRGKKK